MENASEKPTHFIKHKMEDRDFMIPLHKTKSKN